MGVSVSTNSGSRRRGRGRRANLKPMSEINVTPFVDVILCLLIIFMVAAPLMTVGVPIDLPDTAAEALPSEEEEPLTVTLAPNGTVMIFLRADGAIPYEDVMRIMGALNAGGFREIGLVTDSGGPRLDGGGQ
jgi:biopolymer transport protein TolR